MKHFLDIVPRHILDFYLVVVRTHAGSGGFCTEMEVAGDKKFPFE